jgi:hypothetical protein
MAKRTPTMKFANEYAVHELFVRDGNVSPTYPWLQGIRDHEIFDS